MSNPSIDIGIDLGTTESVLAVIGEIQLADGYPPSTYLQECNVTIIPEPTGNPTFPSVFWVDPEDSSKIVIGSEAKQKAVEGHAPIMFSKRSIGSTEPLKLNDRTFTAKEVATKLLAYFKDCAEQALGQQVRRAVITHPAYFEENQIRETREAAIDAGFDMDLPEQMMMEPAAAALAYTKGVEKDPLRVMAYDLGGGTFDVTVLERIQGDIELKSFDGDHLLGGYNFDRALVQWIMDQLKAKGRNISFNDENPDDRSRRAQLLQLAEAIKIKLSMARSAKVAVEIKGPNILVDDDGKNVSILERINREQFSELINEHLDKAILCCQKALTKAKIPGEDLDAILLVGGSTYGQWVAKSVEQAFGKDVQLFIPDLCVASGAAIRAAELPSVAVGKGFEVILEVPSTSALMQINVSGTLVPTGAAELAQDEQENTKILLTTPSGSTLDAELGAGGTFLFPDINLNEDIPTEFELQVVSSKGVPLLTKSFAVQYAPETSGSTEIHNVLPKPIYVNTKDGLRPLAEEGQPLPAKCEFKRPRLHDDSTLDVELYRDGERIGMIEVGNIPEEAGPGSQVIMEVLITPKNEMKGKVIIHSRAGQPLVERPVNIQFPPLQLPELSELLVQFEELEAQRQQEVHLSQNREQRTLLGGKGAKLSKKIKEMFAESLGADKLEIHSALREFKNLIHPPSDDMVPPRTQFLSLIDHCNEMLAPHTSKPEFSAFPGQLNRIQAAGNEAWTNKNQKKWSEANETLSQLAARIEKLIQGDGGGSDDIDPTPLLKDQARHVVDQLRGNLQSKRELLENDARYATRYKSRLDKIEKVINEMDAAVDRIDENLSPRQGLAQVQLALRPKTMIQKQIPEVDKEV